MGRRADHSRDELFELILSKAVEVVENEGISALTARRVSKEVGYSAGTIYNLFENLDALSLHVKAHTLDALFNHIKDIPQGESVEKDILALNAAYFNFLKLNPNTWGSILDRVGANGQPLPEWYLAKVALPFSVIENALQPLFDNDKQAAEYAAHTLWCGVHGIAVLEMENSLEAMGGQDAHMMAVYLIKNFIRGVKA